MMSVLKYKRYSARVELDPEDECFVGRLAGINDVVSFHGSTIAELKTAFREAVDDYIETCCKAGKTPESSLRQSHVPLRPRNPRPGNARRAAARHKS